MIGWIIFCHLTEDLSAFATKGESFISSILTPPDSIGRCRSTTPRFLLPRNVSQKSTRWFLSLLFHHRHVPHMILRVFLGDITECFTLVLAEAKPVVCWHCWCWLFADTLWMANNEWKGKIKYWSKEEINALHASKEEKLLLSCCETTSVRQMSLQPTTPEEQRTFVIILMTASFTFNQPLCIGCWRRVWWWQLFALFWWQPSRPKNGILLAGCLSCASTEWHLWHIKLPQQTSSKAGSHHFHLFYVLMYIPTFFN